MRKIMPLKITFYYVDAPDSKQRLMRAYNRIFAIAKQNIIERRRLEEQKKKGGGKK